MSRRRAESPIIAVYPGTFDPITNGHLDIIERGSRLFERVIVAILENYEKSPLLTVPERRGLIVEATARLGNVTVESFDGLLADYARSRGASVIVRGLRAISDFEYEFQMGLMNRRLNPEMETVFMMPSEAYSYVSSRLVKEVVALGGSVTGLVPEAVERMIESRVGAARKRAASKGRGGKS
ncbi:MAG: pantetheine-phosphate adenylyltransferase [Acidobacteria bacterium]|nr:pantetheine-phosphate adenylyltransferase [Acidobacteriota bacterium]